MAKLIFLVLLILFGGSSFTQSPPQNEFDSYESVKSAVSRLLSYPAYTGTDEKVLNRAGDLAALAVIRTVSIEDLKSRQKANQVLLILNLAFADPELITSDANRSPAAAMLLLDELQSAYCRNQTCNEIENVRFAIRHNTSTGTPMQFVALEGQPPFDAEHTRWLENVLRWTEEIKPGMTRQDLLRVFTTEGGISTPAQRTYVLNGCPYIKVDVEFQPVGRSERDNEGRITLVEARPRHHH